MNDINPPIPSQSDVSPSSEQPIIPPPLQDQEALYKRSPEETNVRASGAVSPELELPDNQRPPGPPPPSPSVTGEHTNRPSADQKPHEPEVAPPTEQAATPDFKGESRGFATIQGNNQKPPLERTHEVVAAETIETPMTRLWTLLRLPSLLFVALVLVTYFVYIPALASLFWFSLLSLFFIFLALIGMGILQGRFRDALWQPLFILILLVVLGAGYLFGLYWALYRTAGVSLEANRTENNFIRLDSPLTLRFGKPMSTRYLEEPIAFAPEVAGTWEINQTLGVLPFTYQATFVPTENLRPGQIYTINFQRLRDGFGRSIQTESLTFQTAGISDIIESVPVPPEVEEPPPPVEEEEEPDDAAPLRILRSDPQEDARLVGLAKQLQFRFSQAVNPESLSFDVSPSHELTVSWNNDNTLLTLTPNTLWQADRRYTIRIEKELELADGQATIGEDWSLNFRTAPALSLTRSVPQHNAADVPSGTLARLTFSNPLLSDQRLDEVILIEPKITVERTLQENTIIIRPLPGWAEETTYSIKIASGLTDRYGTPWTEEHTITFRTVSAEVPEAPPEEEPAEEPEQVISEQPALEPEVSQTTWPEGIVSQEQEKQAVTAALNNFRQNHGILPTTEQPELTAIAEAYCIDFAQHGYLGGNHRDSQGRSAEDRLREGGIEYHNYVEALYADGIWSAEQTVNSWLNSSNRLRQDSFNQTGVCVAKRQDGVYFAVLLVIEPMAK